MHELYDIACYDFYINRNFNLYFSLLHNMRIALVNVKMYIIIFNVHKVFYSMDVSSFFLVSYLLTTYPAYSCPKGVSPHSGPPALRWQTAVACYSVRGS